MQPSKRLWLKKRTYSLHELLCFALLFSSEQKVGLNRFSIEKALIARASIRRRKPSAKSNKSWNDYSKRDSCFSQSPDYNPRDVDSYEILRCASLLSIVAVAGCEKSNHRKPDKFTKRLIITDQAKQLPEQALLGTDHRTMAGSRGHGYRTWGTLPTKATGIEGKRIMAGKRERPWRRNH